MKPLLPVGPAGELLFILAIALFMSVVILLILAAMGAPL
jgi:hypothetical protein